MTQKGNLFKGKQKKKSIPPSRHGKAPHIRKGKRVMKSLKSTTDMEADRELTKFINQCNETKAATVASKEGGEFSILKTIKTDQAGSSKK
ncbi:2,3-bisphosphoglycerate-dependent phosphoglycerate mutase [Carex rostrata]